MGVGKVDIDAGGTIDLDEWIAFFERLFTSGGDEVVEFVCGYLESRWETLQKSHNCGKQVCATNTLTYFESVVLAMHQSGLWYRLMHCQHH